MVGGNRGQVATLFAQVGVEEDLVHLGGVHVAAEFVEAGEQGCQLSDGPQRAQANR